MFSRMFAPPSLLLLAVLALGCEGGTPWAEEEVPTEASASEDLGPTAAYDRRLIFLGPGEQLPTAAVFDFQVLSDSTRLRRGARVRVVDGAEWATLMDAGWQMEPMREAWRLVPHPPLRLTVTDAGELDAIEVRGSEAAALDVRLEPGAVLAEISPDPGTQLVLRQAALALDGEPLEGVLLDAKLGRSLSAAQAAAMAANTAPDTAQDDDSLAVASPSAHPGTEALLLDREGYFMVIARSGSGPIAWIHTAGRNDTRRGVRLEPVDPAPAAQAGASLPDAWRVLSPDGAVVGELQTEAADQSALVPGGPASTLGYLLVSGWLEDRQVRREVFGLVRHIH